MSVPLQHAFGSICFVSNRPGKNFRFVMPQTHSRSEIFLSEILFLFGHYIHDRMPGLFIDFDGMSFRESDDISRVFDHCQLHAITQSEIRNLFFSAVSDSLYNTLYSPASEAARNYDAVKINQCLEFLLITLEFGTIHPCQYRFAAYRACSVLQCLNDADVSIAQDIISCFEVLPDKSDLHFFFLRFDPLHFFLPFSHTVIIPRRKMELIE